MNLHGLLVVDKPRGLSSHDVVARVRRLVRTRRAGHAGTLDPAAEGVLVIAVGRATKLLTSLTSSHKEYAAHIVLGAGSHSGDIEGPVLLDGPSIEAPSRHEIERALARFLGEIEQIPPAHSAIKVGGEPLYRSARRGKSTEVPSRRVQISSLEIISYQFPDLFIMIECGAGTYVRALARDIGDVLGTQAYLHYLLRTRTGSFSLDQAWPLDLLERELRPESFNLFALNPSLVLPVGAALALDSLGVKAWYDGRSVPARRPGGVASTAHAFDADGAWLGTGQYEPDHAAYQPRLVVHG